MKEYPIGTKLTYYGKDMIVVESEPSCEGCVYATKKMIISCSTIHKCSINSRSDGKNIIYKLADNGK